MKAVFAGNNDYALQKLMTALAAGKAPDIAYQYGSSLANLAASPKIVDMSPLIDATPSFNYDDFYKAERLAGTVDGKVIGVPALVDNLALVYNKKLFDAAGVPYPTKDWTWTDFRDAAKKLTDPAAKQFGWAYVADASEDTVWRYLAMLWQADGNLLNADNTAAEFNQAPGQKAAQLLYDMAVTDKSVYLDKGDGLYLPLFNSGKIAMLWTGPWDISSINKGVDFGVQILPADVTHATIAGPDMYVMLDNGSQAIANSWDFIQWFTSPEVHLDYAIATGHLPIRQVRDDAAGVQDVPGEVPVRERLRRQSRERDQGAAQHPGLSQDLGSAGAGHPGRAPGPGPAQGGAGRGGPAGERHPGLGAVTAA